MSMTTAIRGFTIPVDDLAHAERLQDYADKLIEIDEFGKLEQWLYAGAPESENPKE